MADPTEGTATEQPANDSIRDAVTAALTEHGTPGDEPKAAPLAKVIAETAPEPQTETEVDPTAKPERARGPNGRFLKADGTEEAETKTEPAAAKNEGETETAVTTEPPKTAGLPPNWSAADRTAFAALPPDGQKILKSMIDRQEADYTKKTQAVAALKSEYEPVDKMFAPYKAQMQEKGFTPKSVIEAWANVEKRLVDGDGHNVIAGLVKSYRIPIEKIADALGVRARAPKQQPDGQSPEQPQGQNGIQLPPELLQELRELRQRQDAFDRERQDGVRRSQLEREQSAETKLQTFKGAVDEKGNLLHPHYDEVEDDMLLLAQGYSARKQPIPDVDRLYEDAVWRNPTTREKLRTAEMQSAEAKRVVEQRVKSAAARTAGSSITGSPGNGQMPADKSSARSLREELEAASAE